MKTSDLTKFNLPDAPGVYFFLAHRRGGKHAKKIIYIGKATSLKDRVKSYLPAGRQVSQRILLTRGPKIEKMLEEATGITFIKTDSVLEALLLEASMIKKYQPVYNSKEKDDKSYNYVVVTKEDYPRVLIERGRNLVSLSGKKGYKLKDLFGPFPHGSELRVAMKIIRKIFPYRDTCTPCEISMKNNKFCKPCFNAQIGFCPGPCAGSISKKDYQKIIKHLTLFFEGKKTALIRTLKRNMNELAKKEQFEEAERIKRQIFALEHIQDIALLKNKQEDSVRGFASHGGLRIEAYDIAHISGTNVVGAMVVVEDGELAKSQYRKFKIRLDRNNDTANLKEVLSRRFAHTEWILPDIIVVDGGVGQINAAKEVFKNIGFHVGIVSVVKDQRHKAREILGLRDLDGGGHALKNMSLEKSILLANSEAHRFAIKYHKVLRGKDFKI
ncbi:MAG: hypothetical protein CO183_00385 [Candidatus Zambryskibacteria bacterium CG_4_9_14_3_um_filter_42_9]|uniref:Excinuclease ABC subunit C n=1 Tax=Candidatus Zambryskibacteria bacterium CG22_combo_CG10-13_8_21_14_all_42_17 TaxID=1975118 RepID=A0A2H0BCU2_9BACT|nr:MAG: hypothetical protein COX06_02955 [Candidatus Zambryskibacteria bacterium CG22_combo_CG10-13_8_21_14_all_42_17]PJA37014.1 MAG: hypothetical protein CO183_00385 [Candidatus Zambryskibacteria bacterium CG_4_9_14_3_um_filter_42_9]